MGDIAAVTLDQPLVPLDILHHQVLRGGQGLFTQVWITIIVFASLIYTFPTLAPVGVRPFTSRHPVARATHGPEDAG